jgi:hypothetical protein
LRMIAGGLSARSACDSDGEGDVICRAKVGNVSKAGWQQPERNDGGAHVLQ